MGHDLAMWFAGGFYAAVMVGGFIFMVRSVEQRTKLRRARRSRIRDQIMIHPFMEGKER
jgi:hypothetical protein